MNIPRLRCHGGLNLARSTSILIGALDDPSRLEGLAESSASLNALIIFSDDFANRWTDDMPRVFGFASVICFSYAHPDRSRKAKLSQKPLLAIALAVGLLPGCAGNESTSEDEPAGDTSIASQPAPAPAKSEPPAEAPLEPLPEPEGDDDQYTISQVMKLAHETRLYRKLFSTPVDPKIGERLTVLYESLPSQEPPMGSVEDWQAKTTALVESAKAVIGGDEASIGAFKKAVNCSSCHGRHRE